MRGIVKTALGLCVVIGTIMQASAAEAPGAGMDTGANVQPFPVEPPGNDETGISIDRYIGDAGRSPAKITHDTMYAQRIFSEGNPATGSAGAVLAPGEQTDLVTLMPHDVTSLFAAPKELIFYVESGQGRLDDGKQYWDVSSGFGMMIPPNMAHRLTNSGDVPLKMIMFAFNPAVTPRNIVVRDSHKVLMMEHNVHWSHNSKLLFGPEVGVSRVIVITFGPMTIAGPHASPLNTDPNAGGVQWIHVEDGPMLFQLGSEIRRWPLNAGFVTPLDGKTVHARYNIGDTVQTTLFINSGSSMPASARQAAGAALPTFWHNPPLKGEATSPAIADSYLKDSVVPGRPLRK